MRGRPAPPDRPRTLTYLSTPLDRQTGLRHARTPPHWLRDTLYREDNSAIRTRSGPRAMAALRNLAIGALHQAGRHDTTEATRWACRSIDRPFTILGLN